MSTPGEIDAVQISPTLGNGRCAGMRVDGGMCRNPAELRATVTYCWCCGEEDAWCGTCADPDRKPRGPVPPLRRGGARVALA
jgi:hypothetical protein